MSNSSEKQLYPLAVSLSLVVAAIALSFVDLMFLNEVVGRVLDVGTLESSIVSFALGLVGLAIMAHQGVSAAFERSRPITTFTHYFLWILLGVSFASIRLVSASILNLESTEGIVLTVANMGIRDVDIIIAPLMLLLYLATGLMIKDGVQHLSKSGQLKEIIANLKETRIKNKLENDKRRSQAEKDNAARIKEGQERQKDAISRNKQIQLENAYTKALREYEGKLSAIKSKYQDISSNLQQIKADDRLEKQFEMKTKPSLMKIVDGSIESAQNAVALAIYRKYNEDIDIMRGTIDKHNSKR